MRFRRLFILAAVWIILIALIWPVSAIAQRIASRPVMLSGIIMLIGYSLALIGWLWLTVRLLRGFSGIIKYSLCGWVSSPALMYGISRILMPPNLPNKVVR